MTALNAVTAGAVVSTVVILIAGRLSDTYGRRPVFILGAALIALVSVPFFLLLDIGAPWAVFVAVILALGICWSPTTATIGTLTSEIFSTRVRYTGVTLGYQIGAAAAGGTAPLLATWLLSRFNDSWVPIAVYLIAAAILSIVAVSLSPLVTRVETAKLRERGIDPDIHAQAEPAESGPR